MTRIRFEGLRRIGVALSALSRSPVVFGIRALSLARPYDRSMHPNVARVLRPPARAGLEIEVERFPEGPEPPLTRRARSAVRSARSSSRSSSSPMGTRSWPSSRASTGSTLPLLATAVGATRHEGRRRRGSRRDGLRHRRRSAVRARPRGPQSSSTATSWPTTRCGPPPACRTPSSPSRRPTSSVPAARRWSKSRRQGRGARRALRRPAGGGSRRRGDLARGPASQRRAGRGGAEARGPGSGG